MVALNWSKFIIWDRSMNVYYIDWRGNAINCILEELDPNYYQCPPPKFFMLFVVCWFFSKSPFSKIMSPPFRVGRHIIFPRALSVCPSVRLSICLPVTNRVRSITWKPLKLYSRNFIQVSISMRWRAECKNGYSAFYTFWVISLWTLCITKILSAP